MASQIHVVSKEDLNKHTTLNLTLPSPSPLTPSSVRVHTKVVGITTNNLSYAKRGTLLRWWDTYPVPSSAPAPYNDQQKWGIVPAWGYGEVLESTITDIPAGSWIWGFWPTSSHAVDLNLERAGLNGHYREVSEHRQKLMTLYNAYTVVGNPPSEDLQGWMASVSAIWGAGYVMNHNVFSEQPDRLVHPFGRGAWSQQDADLSSAVVVSLSATSKTGMGFAWNLAQRKPGSLPLGFLQATSSPQAVPNLPNSDLHHRVVSYSDLTAPTVADWLSDLKPSRVILLDFGGPTGTAERFASSAFVKLPASTSLISIRIGEEALVAPPTPPAATGGPVPVKLLLNTSTVMDAGAAIEGAESYHQGRLSAFQRWVDEKGMGKMELVWGSGISGDHGIEKTWEDLCNGNLPRHKALAFRI